MCQRHYFCPKCDEGHFSVVESRVTGLSIRRRRRCTTCGYRHTTTETLDDVYTPIADPRSQGMVP